MREVSVLFGNPKTLVGVVTDPDGDSNGLGFLFLNAGYTHRVGPQRLYTRCARELSKLGYTALRFDHAGIGDSRRRTDSLPFPDSAIKDVRDAMDFLEATRGIKRFVVAGICWGADNSVRVAAVDPRIIGVVAVDFYAVPSLRNVLRLYPKRMLAPRSWINLVKGQSTVLTKVFGLMRATLHTVILRKHGEDDVLPSLPPEAVLATLREMVQRGVHLCFAYSSHGLSYDQYVSKFKKGLRDLDPTGRVTVRVFPATDHLFTLRYNQQQLLDYTLMWAKGVAEACRAQAGEPAAEAVGSA